MPDEPSRYQIWDITVAFNADRGGDASGTVRVRLAWERVPDDGPENEALMQLWRLYHAQMIAQAKAPGAINDVFDLG